MSDRSRPQGGSARTRVDVVAAGGTLEVRFPYDAATAAALRGMGARWRPGSRCWVLPDTPNTRERLARAFAVRAKLPPLSQAGAAAVAAVERELQLRRFSQKTRKAYVRHAKSLLRHARVEPEALTPEHVKAFLLHEVERGVSRASHSVTYSALAFLAKQVLKRRDLMTEVPRPKQGKRLPTVAAREEVAAILRATIQPKHYALIMLIYSSGLRVSEAVRLKAEDLVPDRGVIVVRGGKGGKDRIAPLSKALLGAIRRFRAPDEPSPYLFPSTDPGRHVTARTAQKILAKACDAAGIGRRISPHALRHSFATHLHEDGTDIKNIQMLLGHASSRTTDIYTHVSARSLSRIRSPIERLLDENGGRMIEHRDGDPDEG